MIALLQLKR